MFYLESNMNYRLVSFFLALFISFGIATTGPAVAEDLESKATDAVTAILFEQEAEAIASYRISEKGFVDITFARDTPDLIYGVILNKLLHHPDITGVLAGKNGPFCNLYH